MTMKGGDCTWTIITFQRKSIWYFTAYFLHALCVEGQYKGWNISHRETSKKLFAWSGQAATQIFAILCQLRVTIGICSFLKTFLKTLAQLFGAGKLHQTLWSSHTEK